MKAASRERAGTCKMGRRRQIWFVLFSRWVYFCVRFGLTLEKCKGVISESRRKCLWSWRSLTSLCHVTVRQGVKSSLLPNIFSIPFSIQDLLKDQAFSRILFYFFSHQCHEKSLSGIWELSRSLAIRHTCRLLGIRCWSGTGVNDSSDNSAYYLMIVQIAASFGVGSPRSEGLDKKLEMSQGNLKLDWLSCLLRTHNCELRNLWEDGKRQIMVVWWHGPQHGPNTETFNFLCLFLLVFFPCLLFHQNRLFPLNASFSHHVLATFSSSSFLFLLSSFLFLLFLSCSIRFLLLLCCWSSFYLISFLLFLFLVCFCFLRNISGIIGLLSFGLFFPALLCLSLSLPSHFSASFSVAFVFGAALDFASGSGVDRPLCPQGQPGCLEEAAWKSRCLAVVLGGLWQQGPAGQKGHRSKRTWPGNGDSHLQGKGGAWWQMSLCLGCRLHCCLWWQHADLQGMHGIGDGDLSHQNPIPAAWVAASWQQLWHLPWGCGSLLGFPPRPLGSLEKFPGVRGLEKPSWKAWKSFPLSAELVWKSQLHVWLWSCRCIKQKSKHDHGIFQIMM